MPQPLPRPLSVAGLVTLFSVALFFAVGALPATAQERDGPAGDVNEFEEIDGTTLEPAILSYDATMKRDGQPMDLSSTLTVTATSTGETDTWTLVNEIETPPGTNTDSLIVDRSSLLPVSRHRRGGPVMDLTYSGSAAPGPTVVSGELEAGNRSTQISKRLEEPTLAQGVHDVLALAAMPLGTDFRATLRVFSPQEQATKRAEFEVVGTETVETPAGSFETYVVDLNVGAGQVTGTVHLRKEPPHYYVKWRTEVSSGRGTRTVTQALSSIERPATPGGQ